MLYQPRANDSSPWLLLFDYKDTLQPGGLDNQQLAKIINQLSGNYESSRWSEQFWSVVRTNINNYFQHNISVPAKDREVMTTFLFLAGIQLDPGKHGFDSSQLSGELFEQVSVEWNYLCELVLQKVEGTEKNSSIQLSPDQKSTIAKAIIIADYWICLKGDRQQHSRPEAVHESAKKYFEKLIEHKDLL